MVGYKYVSRNTEEPEDLFVVGTHIASYFNLNVDYTERQIVMTEDQVSTLGIQMLTSLGGEKIEQRHIDDIYQKLTDDIEEPVIRDLVFYAMKTFLYDAYEFYAWR